MPHVLIVQFSARRDGSAMSALLLADGFREDGWTTHVAFAADGPMVERFEASGHTTSVVPHKNWLRARDNARALRHTLHERGAARGFEPILRAQRPDLVYVNTAASFAGIWAARKAGVPSLWHIRELFGDVGGELEVPALYRRIARAAFRRLPDALVANSQAVADNVLGEDWSAVEIVPNAVDDRFFDETRTVAEARTALDLPPDGPLVGVPGTLRPMKGHPFFFRALAPLCDQCPDLTLAITGSGAPGYEDELRTLVRDLGIDAQVRFLGSIRDMAAFYRACDVACIPSVAEPFGRTVIEAFAVGAPVVATAVGGIRETVTHGHTGLLVPYGEEAGYRDAVASLLDHPAERARLAEAARVEAEAQYRASIYQERLIGIAQHHLIHQTPSDRTAV